MATVMELREKRASLWEGAKAFLESHRDNDGKLSAEDAASYDKMEADVVALGKEIERMERQAAIDAELAKPTAEPIVNTPKAAVPEKTGRASNAYAEDFGRHLRGRGLVHNVLSEGTDADGGYLVPEEFERQIVTTLDEANVIRSLAKVITTSSERKIPVTSSHSVAQWTPENGNYQESNPTFEQKQIDAYKLTDLIRISQELLQDSAFNLESYIADQFVGDGSVIIGAGICFAGIFKSGIVIVRCVISTAFKLIVIRHITPHIINKLPLTVKILIICAIIRGALYLEAEPPADVRCDR